MNERTSDWFWWVLGCGGALFGLICAGVAVTIGWFYLPEFRGGPTLEPIVIPSPIVTPNENAPLNVAPTVTLATSATASLPATGAAGGSLPVISGNAAVNVPRTSGRPVIDGRLDENIWVEAAVVPLDHLVFSRDTWDGSRDLNAVYRLLWNDDALLIGVTVIDDQHVQPFTGRNSFRGDSLELQFDTDRAGDYGARVSPDDFQFVLSPGDFAVLPPEVYRFRGNLQGRMDDFPAQAATIAATSSEDGYIIEAQLPWSDLGLAPQGGVEIGATLNANDNDLGGSAGQEIMISNVPTRAFADPTTWGVLRLSP